VVTIIENAHQTLTTTVEKYIKQSQTYTTSFSVTEWGISAYVTVYEKLNQVAKFRISDHAVESHNRLFNEVHLDFSGKYDYAVEVALRPENFRQEIITVNCGTVEACVPVGGDMGIIPAHAVCIGQKTSKKGVLCNIYQWNKTRTTARLVRS